MTTETSHDRKPVTAQQSAYDAAYGAAALVPFPDHKVEARNDLVGKTIVSIGGGTGSDVAHLGAKNHVSIVDYSSAAEAAIRSFGLHPVIVDLNQGGRLPFADASVDVMVLKDILEHLMTPRDLLTETLRVLKPDGYAVVSIPNHLNLWGRMRVLFGGNLIWKGLMHDHSAEYDESNYMHIRFFTWKGLVKFLESAGFKISQVFFDFGPLGHYFSIPMYAEHLELKRDRGLLTSKGALFLRFGYPVYRFFNLLVPPGLRNGICRLSPSLTTSCFYVHVRKK